MSQGRSLSRGICTLVLGILGTLLTTIASAQAPAFRGTVLDETGAVIPSTHVTAIRDGSTQTVAAVTDQRGEFNLPLAPGRYALTIAADGFLTVSETIVVADTPARPRPFTLRIAGIQDTVSVSAPRAYGVPATRTGKIGRAHV